MAQSFSKNQLNYAQKKFYGNSYVVKKNLNFIDKVINKTLIFFFLFRFSLVNLKRSVFKKMYNFINFKNDQKNLINFSINLNQNSIDKISNDLNQRNFSFIENFLPEESYKYLNNTWSNINYFKHSKKIIKKYNIGFSYTEGTSLNEIFNKSYNSQAIKQFYEFLLSNDFSKFYNQLLNFEKKNYKLWAINSSMAANGSYLIPHIDGIANKNNMNNAFNFIYFIDGYDENHILGGATGIYKDNDFNHPIFIPTTIKNSLLIYNQSDSFYHGFKTIECPNNIYRKTINFQVKSN